MRSLITTLLLAITLSSTVFADDNSAAANQDIKSLSFGYLLKSFPLCKISSSYGQRCKSLSKKVRNSFSPEDIDGIQKIETIDNELVIEADDWYYSFEVKSISDLLNAFGFSIRLVMSLNSIPALGNPDTVLIWFFKSILLLIVLNLPFPMAFLLYQSVHSL